MTAPLYDNIYNICKYIPAVSYRKMALRHLSVSTAFFSKNQLFGLFYQPTATCGFATPEVPFLLGIWETTAALPQNFTVHRDIPPLGKAG